VRGSAGAARQPPCAAVLAPKPSTLVGEGAPRVHARGRRGVDQCGAKRHAKGATSALPLPLRGRGPGEGQRRRPTCNTRGPPGAQKPSALVGEGSPRVHARGRRGVDQCGAKRHATGATSAPPSPPCGERAAGPKELGEGWRRRCKATTRGPAWRQRCGGGCPSRSREGEGGASVTLLPRSCGAPFRLPAAPCR
jgi:hypothetical protein